MRARVAWLCLAFWGCRPAAEPRPVSDPVPTAPLATPPAFAPALAVTATPEASSSAAPDAPGSPPAATVAPQADAVSEPPLVMIEAPYSALGHARLATEMLTLARDDELLQWALGGSSDPAHPANRAGYHPATRVVIDVSLLARAPKGTTKQLLRVARSSGYWPMRSCFEQAQRVVTKSERSARMRLTLGARGKVLGARSLGASAERDYGRCVLERAKALDFSPGAGKKLDIELSVKEWPGHAPVPPRAPEQATSPQLSASDSAALYALLPALGSCYARARTGDPNLWGRLAFRVAVGEAGAVSAAEQVETRFPNADVAECARSALLTLTLTSAAKGELSLAFRFGHGAPPAPAPAPPGVEGVPPSLPAPPAPAPPAPADPH